MPNFTESTVEEAVLEWFDDLDYAIRYRDNQRTVGIAREDRLRHVHVLGRTGVGKSTLLLNQIRSDIERGAGLCVIDPHGDLPSAKIGAAGVAQSPWFPCLCGVRPMFSNGCECRKLF